MAKADLHIHTTASDGQMSPAMVVQEAARLNLSVIAITDHDSVAAVAEAQKEAVHYDIEVMPGSEITTSFGERECHMLAYDFDLTSKKLKNLLRLHQKARVDRARWIIKQLRKQGFELDIDEVLAEANGRNVGRPHIAEILRKKGYIATIKEAFIRYLSDEALGTIKSNYLDFRRVIKIVKAAGGVMVLAHPGRLYTLSECKQFVDGGIDGIEALHPSHNYTIQKDMEAFADKHHLLTTGGSDFHGACKEYYRHFGTLTINQRWAQKIKALATRRKEVAV